jgi:uncharacterized membrane protein
VFIVVYFVIDSVRKLLDIISYVKAVVQEFGSATSVVVMSTCCVVHESFLLLYGIFMDPLLG